MAEQEIKNIQINGRTYAVADKKARKQIDEQNKKIPNVKCGVFSSDVRINQGQEQKFTITFDEPFETTPVVVCTPMNNSFVLQVYKDELFANKFSVYAYNYKANNDFLGFHWIAVAD